MNLRQHHFALTYNFIQLTGSMPMPSLLLLLTDMYIDQIYINCIGGRIADDH